MVNFGKLKSRPPKEKTTTRESFLDSRWRHTAAEIKRYEKGSFGLGNNPYYDETADLTEQILSTYNTCANERHSRWMRDLAHDSMTFIADMRGTRVKAIRQEAIYNQSIAQVVGELFNMLRSYSFEFNHSIGWNELYITCSKPAFVTEVLRYNIFREPVESTTNFRARLSTRSWSVVIRGQRNKIDFLLIPVFKVIGLSKTETEYPPVLSLTGKLMSDSVQWYLDDQPLLQGQLETIAMEVFAALIHKSKEAIQTMQDNARKTAPAITEEPLNPELLTEETQPSFQESAPRAARIIASEPLNPELLTMDLFTTQPAISSSNKLQELN